MEIYINKYLLLKNQFNGGTPETLDTDKQTLIDKINKLYHENDSFKYIPIHIFIELLTDGNGDFEWLNTYIKLLKSYGYNELNIWCFCHNRTDKNNLLSDDELKKIFYETNIVIITIPIVKKYSFKKSNIFHMCKIYDIVKDEIKKNTKLKDIIFSYELTEELTEENITLNINIVLHDNQSNILNQILQKLDIIETIYWNLLKYLINCVLNDIIDGRDNILKCLEYLSIIIKKSIFRFLFKIKNTNVYFYSSDNLINSMKLLDIEDKTEKLCISFTDEALSLSDDVFNSNTKYIPMSEGGCALIKDEYGVLCSGINKRYLGLVSNFDFTPIEKNILIDELNKKHPKININEIYHFTISQKYNYCYIRNSDPMIYIKYLYLLLKIMDDHESRFLFIIGSNNSINLGDYFKKDAIKTYFPELIIYDDYNFDINDDYKNKKLFVRCIDYLPKQLFLSLVYHSEQINLTTGDLSFHDATMMGKFIIHDYLTWKQRFYNNFIEYLLDGIDKTDQTLVLVKNYLARSGGGLFFLSQIKEKGVEYSNAFKLHKHSKKALNFSSGMNLNSVSTYMIIII